MESIVNIGDIFRLSWLSFFVCVLGIANRWRIIVAVVILLIVLFLLQPFSVVVDSVDMLICVPTIHNFVVVVSGRRFVVGHDLAELIEDPEGEMVLEEKRRDALSGQTFFKGLLGFADGLRNARSSDGVSALFVFNRLSC